MSNLRNTVQLIGHLGADPEIKTIESGKKFVTFRVATSDRYKNQQGEWVDDTQWHNCIIWDNWNSKSLEQFKKGSFVIVQGKIAYRSYEDTQGVKRYTTEIRVRNFILLDKRQSEEQAVEIINGVQDDDLPF